MNIVALNPNGSLSVIETFNNLSVSASDPTYIVDRDERRLGVCVGRAGGDADSVAQQSVPAFSPASPPLPPRPSLREDSDGVLFDPTLDGSGGYFTNALNADGTGTGGVRLLDRVDIFNLLCVPGETEATEHPKPARSIVMTSGPFTSWMLRRIPPSPA